MQKKEEIIIKNNEIYKAKVEPSEGKMLPLLDDSYKKIVQETGAVEGTISNVTKSHSPTKNRVYCLNCRQTRNLNLGHQHGRKLHNTIKSGMIHLKPVSQTTSEIA